MNDKKEINEEELFFDETMTYVEDTRFVEGKTFQVSQSPPYVIVEKNKENLLSKRLLE